MVPLNLVLDPKPFKRQGKTLITNGECPQELKEENDKFALMGENKVDNESLSIVKSILEEFLHENLEVIQFCLPSMGNIQQHDLKVTLDLLL